VPGDHSTQPTALEVGEASKRLRRSSWITDAIAAMMPVAVGALAVAVGVLGFAYLRTSHRADAVVVALGDLRTQSAELQSTNDRLARLAEQFAVLVDRTSTPEERDAARAEVTRLREEIAAARSGTTTTTTQPRASAPSSTTTTTAPPASSTTTAPSSTTTAPPPTTTTTAKPPGCALGTLPVVCPP
jgi:cell division septation protein DedD